MKLIVIAITASLGLSGCAAVVVGASKAVMVGVNAIDSGVKAARAASEPKPKTEAQLAAERADKEAWRAEIKRQMQAMPASTVLPDSFYASITRESDGRIALTSMIDAMDRDDWSNAAGGLYVKTGYCSQRFMYSQLLGGRFVSISDPSVVFAGNPQPPAYWQREQEIRAGCAYTSGAVYREIAKRLPTNWGSLGLDTAYAAVKLAAEQTGRMPGVYNCLTNSTGETYKSGNPTGRTVTTCDSAAGPVTFKPAKAVGRDVPNGIATITAARPKMGAISVQAPLAWWPLGPALVVYWGGK